MDALEAGHRLFAGVDQAETDSVNFKNGGEKDSEQEDRDKDLDQGATGLGLTISKFHTFHNEPPVCRCQVGRLCNLR